MKALGRAVSPEEMAAVTAEVDALLPQIWELLTPHSPSASMSSLLTVIAYILMSEPSVAEANATLFFSGVVAEMARIKLSQIELGGLPN